jgi:O-antigen/teichoic acid export membrane protein
VTSRTLWLRQLYRSPSLQSAAIFGIGGLAFSVANLVLARTISALDYGLLSLMIGVVAVAGPIGPLGLDFVLVRRGLALNHGMRRLALPTAALVGLGALSVSAWLYQPGAAMLAAMLVATVAASIAQLVAAHYQSQNQFGISMLLMQATNWSLLMISTIAWATGIAAAAPLAALIATSGTLIATWGWLGVARRQPGELRTDSMRGLWHEAISLMLINVTGSALLQLERLIVPMTVGIEQLALFGVAAALVGSPFRMLQMAATFTIVPRLRDASSVAERRRLLRHEFALFCLIMVPGSLALWLLAPPVAHWFLRGKYDLGGPLILAMIISGLLKVLGAFTQAVVSALAPENGLRLLGMLSWACIALAVVAAFVVRSWGLVGVVYAISCGWLARIIVAGWISAPHLRASPEQAG